MSYYFAIVGTKDNPLFEYEFGTSKQGGDGLARFREEARHMNQFIVHSSLDIVEEAQWTNGCMYHKTIDRFYNNHISLFLTGTTTKFMLLHCPDPDTPQTPSAMFDSRPVALTNSLSASAHAPSASLNLSGQGTSLPIRTNPRQSMPTPLLSATSISSKSTSGSATSSGIAGNPTSPATEEAIRSFFADIFEQWVKTAMNPFYTRDMPIKSAVFRQKVGAAGRKYL